MQPPALLQEAQQRPIERGLVGQLDELDVLLAAGAPAELWEVSKALTSGMGTKDLLDKILDSAMRVTGADTGSIMLMKIANTKMR